MRDTLLFYDVEVFKYDALVVFKDINNNEVAHFWNNRDRIGAKFPDDIPSGFEGVSDLVEQNTLVGYNNFHYDDYIISAMMNPVMAKVELIKRLNDNIISGSGSTIKVNPIIDSIDVMQQISVSRPSLKQIEGNMGKSIIESSVPFDIDSPLTDEQRQEVLEYCRYDVESTIEVYKLRTKSYFDTKKSLIQLLPEDSQRKAQRWNTTTISAIILLENSKSSFWLKYRVPEKYWRNVPGIPDKVWDMWELSENQENVSGKGLSEKFTAFNCEIVMGLGGLHGAPKKPARYGRILLADVGSMYPSIICSLNALGSATAKYDALRQERLRIKHTDKTKANALKLILNSVYGNFKNSYSALFNPWASGTVCIYGQIALFTLCKKLYDNGYEIININTDGVAFVDNPDLGDAYDRICREWEQEFSGLLLEIDTFDKWIQKDVNNYIALQGDHIKTKGGEVNKYSENKYFDNNNARIVQMALVDKLLYNTDPLTTFVQHRHNPLLWQYILKAGSTYTGVQDKDGLWQNNVNRVFAAVSDVEWTKLYKVRKDGGLVNFPDVPERMFLWNGDIHDIRDFDKKLDMEHYLTIVYNKLKGWSDG